MPRRSLARPLDALALLATRSIHRVAPTVPVLREWPEIWVIREAAYRRLLAPLHERLLAQAAARHRRRLQDLVVIGVTGSAGKTTTKDLLAAILATRFAVVKTGGTNNVARDAARTLLRVRTSSEVCIIELGVDRPGSIDGTLEVVRPRYAVVTAIGTDHYSAFHSIDAIAEEKGKLVAAIPREGAAVLNADDPRVLAMRRRCAGQVITYGRSQEAMLRAHDVTARWPETLSFTATWRGESIRVHTQLLGAYWVVSVLAALAAGVTLGVPLSQAAAAVATVPPFPGRMSTAVVEGVTFIRDDWKAPSWTMAAALDFMREARAQRKIIVLGTISDTVGTRTTPYLSAAEAGVKMADQMIFVGPRSFSALRTKQDVTDQRLLAFATVKAASDHLRRFLRAGDLVLLKGSHAADHLMRVILARTDDVACWRADCGKQVFCDSCSLRLVASGDDGASAAVRHTDLTADWTLSEGRVGERPQVVVGFGNPGAKFEGTPHNLGHAVLDRLAASSGAVWTSTPEAVYARIEEDDSVVHLVKPNVSVNATGAALKALADRLGLEPRDCILVHDDLALPVGTVRTRMRGSDGGHRGVRSVLEAFQSDQFPRVKIGVAVEGRDPSAADYVLTPFPAAAGTVVEQSCGQAARKLVDLLKTLRANSGARTR